MSRARELSKLGNANAISVDTWGNNVGLGTTTSIQYKLDVVGDANFSESATILQYTMRMVFLGVVVLVLVLN